ncbi:MAG: BrnA antitoxin family protein [Legionellales bacterium]|nr:BrnA antitoxin family protein [Legionellales bacterium]
MEWDNTQKGNSNLASGLDGKSDLTAKSTKAFNKERITIRIDRDVLEWFRSQAPNQRGYQSRINQALREYMQNGVKSMEDILRKVMRDELHKLENQ